MEAFWAWFKWLVDACDAHPGFFSFLASVVPSIIAIGVAIYTVRAPYKRRIRVTASIFEGQQLVYYERVPALQIYGVHVVAQNVGRADVPLTFVGLELTKGHRLGVAPYPQLGPQYMGSGTAHPGECIEALYPHDTLLPELRKLSPNASVWPLATDGFGKQHRGRAWKARKLIREIECGWRAITAREDGGHPRTKAGEQASNSPGPTT